MKKLFFAVLTVLLFTVMTSSVYSDNDTVIEKIRHKYAQQYERYKGFTSTGEFNTRILNSNTGNETGTTYVLQQRKDYFGARPEIKAIKYIDNGKEKNPSDYKPMPVEPGHLLFDSQHDSHYNVTVTGRKKINGQDCYELKITPLAKTDKHIMGMLYCSVADYRPVYLEGSLAKMPAGMESMRMKFYYAVKGEPFVLQKSWYDMVIDIPVVFPDKRLIIDGTYRNVTMIAK